jgi:hypothetical protein
MEYTRVFEHTHDDVKRPFAALDDTAIASLMNLPTLFAYEKYLRAPARVGRITEVTRRQTEFAFTFAFDPTVSPIPYDTFTGLLRDLDIDPKWEVNRSHWAVKNVDLARVLHSAGLVSSPSLQPQARPPRVFPRTTVAAGCRPACRAVSRHATTVIVQQVVAQIPTAEGLRARQRGVRDKDLRVDHAAWRGASRRTIARSVGRPLNLWMQAFSTGWPDLTCPAQCNASSTSL